MYNLDMQGFIVPFGFTFIIPFTCMYLFISLFKHRVVFTFRNFYIALKINVRRQRDQKEYHISFAYK